MSEKEAPIDHEFVDHIVCPWCGRKHDTTDYTSDEREREESCERCGKAFIYSAFIDVSWSTRKVEDEVQP